MIIGKAGSNVRLIKEETGAVVQISQKSEAAAAKERTVAVSANTDEALGHAMDRIIAKVGVCVEQCFVFASDRMDNK